MRIGEGYLIQLEETRRRISSLSPEDTARRTGGREIKEGIELNFLSQKIKITFNPYRFMTSLPYSEKMELFILHYLLFARLVEPRGEWISFREVPSGTFYYPSFRKRCEEVLERIIPGKEERWKNLMEEWHAREEDDSYRLQVLPRIPVRISYFPPEEELPSRVTILFDSTISLHLPTEDIAIMGELITGFVEERLHHE